MREILFRGKRIDNGEWTMGTPFIAANSCKMIQAVAVHPDFVDEGNVYYSEGHNVDLETVGQYTGLTDKNGKKIFEGDIVREAFEGRRQESDGEYTWISDFYGHKIGYVAFSGTGTRLIASKGELWVDEELVESYKPSRRTRLAAYRCEVIGNIHDNPELLEALNG